MTLYYFSQKTDTDYEKILSIIESIVPARRLDVLRSVRQLSEALRRFHTDRVMAVILAAEKKELTELSKTRDLLKDIPVLLILPNRDKDTIAEATRLCPRHICCMDDEWPPLQEMLLSMILKYES